MSALDLAVEIPGGIILFGAVGAYWYGALRGAARHERAVLKEHSRAIRAHYAAVEASEDAPSFSPDVIDQSVTDIVALADNLWRTGAFGSLYDRPDAGLVRAWARSWQTSLGRDLEVVGPPSIDLLSVVNRNDENEDRIVARVRLRIHCKHPKVGMLGPHHAHVDQRWTFGRTGGDWFLLSMGGDPLAGPLLMAALIPSASSDTERLTEESLAELADTQKLGADVPIADLVTPEESPAVALLDLSVVDGRFLPALIQAELTHLLAAWEGAAVGSEAPLEALADDRAREALLRPRQGQRLIVRDVVLKSWQPTKLNLAQVPPTIELDVSTEAVRYVVNDVGRPLDGNPTMAQPVPLHWMLELTDSPEHPWRLATSDVAARSIATWS